MAILARPAFAPHLVAVASERSRECSRETARGDAAARVTALYAEHGARIHRFLRDLLCDAALAADGTQETFVRAYKKLDELDASARVTPWLFGIARNVSLELRKARMRAGRHLVSIGDARRPGDGDADAAAFGSPESDYLGREALRVVGEALSLLPEDRRAMLLLRLDHGLSYDDIAATMGCSLAKVKVEIFRAREVLRATMADYENGGPNLVDPRGGEAR